MAEYPEKSRRGKSTNDEQCGKYPIVGVDSRGQNYRGRSDTIIVASINHNTRTITFVSFFRAIEVKIPGYSEPTLLNAAYAYGGPRLAIQTVEANFGIPITGFLTFNFASLQKLVDAVGGVKITMTAAEARALDASQRSQFSHRLGRFAVR